MAETEGLLQLWSTIAPVEAEQWEKLVPGPSVLDVAARLSTVPSPFLAEQVSVRALAGDVLGPATVLASAGVDDDRTRRGAAIGLWLFASGALVGAFAPPLTVHQAATAVDALGLRLAPVVDPAEWIADAERREEAARTFLLWNRQLPAGEDVAAARAALAARDSLQFNRALADSYAEHRHRAELRRRLEEARAREAAARYTRE